MVQRLDAVKTTWHITFGTYGARLHGGERATVDRKHNQIGEPFVGRDAERVAVAQGRMRGDAICLGGPQRGVIEALIPEICRRGGWGYRICAVPEDGDHVHVLLDAPLEVNADAIMRWLKRWIGEELTKRWNKPMSGTWWAKAGSTKAVKDVEYLNNVYEYIRRQRTMGQSE